ncbi:MAG: hypothetical protein GYA24_14365 [Candidatus Lokiarchaeota archaeon]|nr:hypothetical protein [Candidatus Lokiarchaeota archaeon]
MTWIIVTALVCIVLLILFQGSLIGVAITIAALISSLLLKLSLFKMRARAEEKRIAVVKTMQTTSRVATARPGSGRADDPVSNPVDASQLKATDGFALVHMGPPELIDLDLSRKKDSRGRPTIDTSALEDQRDEVVAKAIEFEDRGAIDKAIAQYEKAVLLARQIGNDAEVASYQNRIAQLKQEKAGH